MQSQAAVVLGSARCQQGSNALRVRHDTECTHLEKQTHAHAQDPATLLQHLHRHWNSSALMTIDNARRCTQALQAWAHLEQQGTPLGRHLVDASALTLRALSLVVSPAMVMRAAVPYAQVLRTLTCADTRGMSPAAYAMLSIARRGTGLPTQGQCSPSVRATLSGSTSPAA